MVNVFVPPHPLIKHWVSVLRNEQTPPPIFKCDMQLDAHDLVASISFSGEIQSPLGVASVEFIDPREAVAVVPILRAGLALAEHASSILPATKTYHLGGTVITAIDLIKERGVDNQHIKVVCAVTCPPALQKLSDKMIIPGLGDAGDRSFGT
ncbi:hypothetical protein L1987_59893 [Smallanthus sonchifolius]|uniref:Uncharacterized protein n=1 Tax=Smallanthus sonchifolius TaxID=185202 RepID=A0ACB9D6Y1_9ASTR|nr:hypothetical protein L1987_59893 [Smallanthus sonchifolius]